MKRILFFVFGMLACSLVNAQTISYHPLHGDYSQYVYRFQWWDGSTLNEVFHKTVWSGDTTIGGETYTRIFQDGIYAGGIREDVSNQQRFFINPNGQESDITIDYDLSVGTLLTDSSVYINAFRTYLEIYPGNYFASYDTLVVAQLDSVLESSGNYSVSYRLTRPQNTTGESVLFNTYSGLLELNGFEYNYSQLCYREDGEQTPPGQQTPWTVMCDLGITENDRIQLELFPNPASESFSLSGDLESLTDLAIYDLSGTLIRQIPLAGINAAISIGELKSGVYFLAVNGNQKVLRFQKM